MATTRIDLTKGEWVSAATADCSLQNRSGAVVYVIEKASAPSESDTRSAFKVTGDQTIVLTSITDTVYAYATTDNGFLIRS